MRRGVCVALLMAALPLSVAAGNHIVRLLVLAATGLAGLYMMHLLAQDWNNYNKITRHPVAKLLFKRHAHNPAAQPSRGMEAAFLASTRAKLRRAQELDNHGCARRLVCQLAATPHHHRRPYQDDLLLMIRKSNLGSQDSFHLAADVGYQAKNQSVCYEYFNQCPFQTAQLLNVIELPSVAYTSNALII